MKTIIYKQGKTGKTALAIRKQLNSYSSRSLDRGDMRPAQVSKCLRWGSTDYPEITAHTLNSAESISLSSNKLKSLETLKEAGISVPWFVTHRDRPDLNSLPLPLVGRTTYHQGGSNFKICRDSYSFRMDTVSTHWLELINIYKEYRVHVFKGEVIGISRKTDEGVEGRIINRYTRNHHNGWRFIKCDINLIQNRVKEISINAVKTLGLDFGAVDIILSDGSESTSTGSRKYYVLEVNSAPGMEPNSSIFEAYLRRFKEWME